MSSRKSGRPSTMRGVRSPKGVSGVGSASRDGARCAWVTVRSFLNSASIHVALVAVTASGPKVWEGRVTPALSISGGSGLSRRHAAARSQPGLEVAAEYPAPLVGDVKYGRPGSVREHLL